MSLVLLWRRQGKQHETQKTLSGISNWFTEGFGAKDWQKAKALLATLDRQ